MHDGSNSSNLVRPIMDALFSVDGFHGLETWADAVSRYEVVPIKMKTITQMVMQWIEKAQCWQLMFLHHLIGL
jgi:hypothetical protein